MASNVVSSVCLSVEGVNPRAPVQAHKPLYNYFYITLISVDFVSMKYSALKFAISGKGCTADPRYNHVFVTECFAVKLNLLL